MLRVTTDAEAAAVDMAQTLDVKTLPRESLTGLRGLPNTSAVYFVVLNDRVVYIGATLNLKLRWKEHIERRVLRHGGHIAWLGVEQPLLRSVERAMIHEFAPPMNNHHTEIGRGTRGQGLGAAYRALQFLISQEK